MIVLLASSLTAIGVLALLGCGGEPPQSRRQGRDNPSEARVDRRRPAAVARAEGTAPRGDAPREARLTLAVDFVDATIRNPATQLHDQVRLRAYRAEGSPSDAPLIAPTIRVLPGETVRLTIDNRLPLEEGCETSDHNIPHCFNTTNVHTHGLWISPSGNSDNVLLSIFPKTTFNYQFDIAADHPAGTFWYHPHRHGSTAVQVGSGLAGALIVDGQRLPTPTATGDIDTLLKAPDGTPFPERILVFQQIPYACRDANGAIKKDGNGQWICDSADVGQVDAHSDIFIPPSAWRNSGRFTMINGRTAEPLVEHAVAGRLERWRLIHAGVRATIKLQFRKRLPGSRPPGRLAVRDHARWIDANCDMQQALTQWELAADGHTRDRLEPRTTTHLQPGYRSDLLVLFPSAGDYCVVDEEASPSMAVNGVSANRQLLTIVTVDAGAPVGDPTAHVKQALKDAAGALMPPPVRQKVQDDLDILRLDSFTPLEDLRPMTPSGTQQLLFSMVPKPAVGTNESDLQPYDPDRMDRTLVLDAVEDWTLRAKSPGSPHPFHIHVNPFQILSVVGDDGTDLTADPASEFFGMKGVWKDTVLVPGAVTITVRSKYRRYTGDFVLHCHILDHEDRGMMQNIRIVPTRDARREEPAARHAH
jgi:FtsP/CotA-like multicopper oxidase with cupredoxin domain